MEIFDGWSGGAADNELTSVELWLAAGWMDVGGLQSVARTWRRGAWFNLNKSWLGRLKWMERTGSMCLPWRAACREDIKLDEESADGERRGRGMKSWATVARSRWLGGSRTPDLYGRTTRVSLDFCLGPAGDVVKVCQCRREWNGPVISCKFLPEYFGIFKKKFLTKFLKILKKSGKIRKQLVRCSLTNGLIMQIFWIF